MTDKTFHFLIGNLYHERIEQIPPRIFETMLSLVKEGPLKASGLFQTFIEKVSNPSGEQQSIVYSILKWSTVGPQFSDKSLNTLTDFVTDSSHRL
jgi:hypothetical protein